MRLTRLAPFIASIWVAIAGPAGAHPHVFVDTSLRLVAGPDGQPVGVEVTWRYDELYSLLIFEDMGLDSDYDGTLTEAEIARLDGFDMQWVEGFAGDVYANGPDGPLELGPPEPAGTKVADGRIETRHFRPFASTAPQRIVLQAYDPTFYTDYDLTGGVVAPEGCRVRVEGPDLEAAQARLEAELDGRADTIDDFPEVGDAFAETVTIRCGAGS